MVRKLAAAVAAVFLLLVCVAGAVAYVLSQPIEPADATAGNAIAKVAETQWPPSDPAAFPPGPDFVVLDSAGDVVLARGAGTEGAGVGALEAYRGRWPSLPVRVDGELVGTVLVADTAQAQVTARNNAALIVVLAALGVAAVAVGAWSLWLWRAVLVPFRRLDRFAARVAGGDLDAPLTMDRHNVFGSFTEAFDIMRTKLAESRAREEELAEDKRTLVAQLSHDIRTPVASIGATAELLELTEADAARQARLEVIGRKVGQVTDLLDDLFRAGEEDLTALPVAVGDIDSAEIRPMIVAADTTDAAVIGELPRVLVSVDPRRLQQVIDNVLVNAAKYAGTPVAVAGEVRGGHLRVTFTDSGGGVADDELDVITRKHVRGSNAAGLPGSGLGLYTSSWLMEQMGGALSVRNVAGGLQVVLEIALAGSVGSGAGPAAELRKL